MNKYLFRAKRKDNDEWIEGGYCYYGNESYIIASTRYIPDTRDWDEADYYENNPVYKPIFIKVYSETVGQFTGMCDKNDKKIFEGDIVKTDKFNTPNKRYVIKYDLLLGAFIGEDNGTMYFTTFDGDSELFKIIGNIHDNPELLNN